MHAMAPTRPAELHLCYVRPTTGPAAAEARSRVRLAICSWMSLSIVRKVRNRRWHVGSRGQSGPRR